MKQLNKDFNFKDFLSLAFDIGVLMHSEYK